MKIRPAFPQFILAAISLLSLCLNNTDCSVPGWISIPAAGNSWIITDQSKKGIMVTRSGITGWTDTCDIIRTFFHTDNIGVVTVAIRARVESGKSIIRMQSGDIIKNFLLDNTDYDTILIGDFRIENPGYQLIDLKGLTRTGKSFASVTDFFIKGSATNGNISFIKDDFYFGRRGPSVHLRYDLPTDQKDITWFYNEITVPEGNDVTGSYFMANGFNNGYFGIQVNSDSERRILFSVWSPYKTDKPEEIPEDNKIILLKKGKDVIAGEFGNEGSGGQSFKRFNWRAGVTYGFLLRGEPSVNNSSDYTAYFFDPVAGKWNLIACFRRPKTTDYLKNLYSFLENFIPETGYITRMGSFTNQWICNRNGLWIEISDATFTADATAKKGSRLDYTGGVDKGSFFLKNCGFFSNGIKMNTILSRVKTGIKPVIDFNGLE